LETVTRYSVEFVLLNKHQISGGGAKLHCYQFLRYAAWNTIIEWNRFDASCSKAFRGSMNRWWTILPRSCIRSWQPTPDPRIPYRQSAIDDSLAPKPTLKRSPNSTPSPNLILI